MSLISRSSIDMNKNQLINVVIHNVTSLPPTGVKGQLVYLDANGEQTIYYHDGSTWVDLLSDSTVIQSANGSAIVVQNNNGTFILDVKTDGVTLETVNEKLQIKDLGVSTAKIANNAVTTIKVVDNAITFSKMQDIASMTIIGNLSGTTTDPSAISVINTNDMSGASSTNLATAGSIKAYIDSTMAGLGNLEGSFDANAASTFPTGTNGTKKGDYWYVTVAGTVQGVTLNVGDVLIANQDGALGNNANHWIFLETNRDQATTTVLGLVKLATPADALNGTNATDAITPATLKHVLDNRKATETVRGTIEIATQAETNAGTDNERAVTPLKLKTYVDGAMATLNAVEYLWTSGTTIQVPHTFNTKAVGIHVYDVNGNRTLVGEVVSATSHVNLTANPAPTTAAPLTVIIQK